ncbi:MAG: stage III sporulation protein AB [Clostridia bacterium]|nr:stage III sporulation protein AB [Clostridia bacterium]
MSGAVRIIAAAVVVMGGGYIGLLFSSRLAVRVSQIEQLLCALTQIEFNISFLKMPISKALSAAACGNKGAIGRIFSEVARQIKELNISPSVAFERAVMGNRSSLCILKEDMEIVSEFAKNLGKGDVDSEINNIKAACAKLTLAKARAEGELARRGKLWRGMGMLGGMLLVILLF